MASTTKGVRTSRASVKRFGRVTKLLGYETKSYDTKCYDTRACATRVAS